MEGTVTISVSDFEMLRQYEKAANEAYTALQKCDFADDEGKTVGIEPVLDALKALSFI